MNKSKITRRLTVGAATAAAVCTLGLAGVPAASAAPAQSPPIQPQQAVGSVSLCLDIPLGSLSFSVCI
ncbi:MULTISPECIES: hypothetical protein [Gordonia]|uniref:Uncharacterized protein n=1 Tax=Gordonia amicalis TaxID=89053 RepID=A0AAE4R8S6_9ACTN|nr:MULTISPECIES: hypothetical protein [Gordonia]ATD72453.1 hypothetical protein CNO18_21480 [Gordonia sp. 1D]KAF0967598.1 hypothetical protein BPODLACK_03960 [Gordonia sp. YY1]MCZ0915019.1 hypothetical protein [Gordonia amicalis]MCZ4579042.1 hypothetical protein [Gordonia amicalis]MCZ4652585.1 hypothetical protein [Gordonia amicalis]